MITFGDVITTRAMRHLATMAMIVVTALGMLVLGGFVAAKAASAAATAPAATQCDPPAFPTGAGFQVTCTINIANTVTAAGVSSSTVTATACLAAAGVLPPFGCTTTVTTSNQLVTSVDQCNGVAFGGGSNVTCNVSVVNTVPTGGATSGVTVNQCVGSGTGGGTQPTIVCAPVASTTNATVTQCNGSGNGGGASTRVQCNVIGGASAEPVTVNQCNGSANGGGSTVTCSTNFTNVFTPATPTTTTTLPTTPTTVPTTPTTPTTPTGTPTTPGGTGSAGSPTAVGSGVTGTTGSSPGAGGSTGSTAAIGSTLAPQGSLAFTGANITGTIAAALIVLGLGLLTLLLSGFGARRNRRKTVS